PDVCRRGHRHARDFGCRPGACQGRARDDWSSVAMSMKSPLLVGAGQVLDKPADPRDGLEPLALMETAARRAFDDAGAGSLATAIDTVAVVTNVFHDYGDTATLLADRLG